MSTVEIEDLDHVKLLVNSFYDKVRNDDLLKDIFNNVIQDQWPSHLEKMYRFWQTVLLEEYTYQGSPFLPHASLPVQKIHFDRWLFLFNETIDEHFKGEKAERAKWQGERMAIMFLSKIEMYKGSNKTPIK
jgi:hemoglobin